MKLLFKILILTLLFLGNTVNAEPFKVLVLPVDLFSVCENYYCFPESSEIFANDIINNLSKNKKIEAIDSYAVRKKTIEQLQLRASLFTALNKYKNTNTVDFVSLKKVADEFGVNSILLISSSVNNKSVKRNIWEILETMSAFDVYNRFTLETNVVLLDNVNDIVMWSGKFEKSLGDNEARFWAKNAAEACSQLEKIRLYSKEILAQNVAENVMLRFYPKTISTNISKPVNQTQTKDFRPNALEWSSNKIQDDKDYGEIHTDSIFTF